MSHDTLMWRAQRLACQTEKHTYNFEVVDNERSIAILLTKKDAALIAAAPELLAACELARDILKNEFGSYRYQVNFGFIDDAIKKAKGE